MGTNATDLLDADLVIASDGINSRIRQKYASVFQPDVVTRPNRFIWLGTTKLFDAFNFLFEKTEHGWFQAHVYKFDDQTTTFIVETPEHVWRAHGLDQANTEQSIAFCEALFAKHLKPLLSNLTKLANQDSAFVDEFNARFSVFSEAYGQNTPTALYAVFAVWSKRTNLVSFE